MIDLSSNGIHFLPDKEKLENLKKVEYFNFHKNLLVGWRQLENLTCLTNLRHMTLQGNPCAKIKGYRQFLVDSLPHLRSLDEFIVMDYERKDLADAFAPDVIKKQKLLQLNRFRPFNPDTTSWRSTRFIIQQQPPISPPVKEESKEKIPTQNSPLSKAKSKQNKTDVTVIEDQLDPLIETTVVAN